MTIVIRIKKVENLPVTNETRLTTHDGYHITLNGLGGCVLIDEGLFTAVCKQYPNLIPPVQKAGNSEL